MIGDDIKITVAAICGDKVKIGVEAPKDIRVHRKEVYDAISREKAANGITATPLESRLVWTRQPQRLD